MLSSSKSLRKVSKGAWKFSLIISDKNRSKVFSNNSWNYGSSYPEDNLNKASLILSASLHKKQEKRIFRLLFFFVIQSKDTLRYLNFYFNIFHLNPGHNFFLGPNLQLILYLEKLLQYVLGTWQCLNWILSLAITAQSLGEKPIKKSLNTLLTMYSEPCFEAG